MVCHLFQNYAYFDGSIFCKNQLIHLACRLFQNYDAYFDWSITNSFDSVLVCCKNQLGFFITHIKTESSIAIILVYSNIYCNTCFEVMLWCLHLSAGVTRLSLTRVLIQVSRHTVVSRVAQEAGAPHHEYIYRKKENMIFTPM